MEAISEFSGTHMAIPYPPKKQLSINANPNIGPAAPANRNLNPSAFHKLCTLKLGLACDCSRCTLCALAGGIDFGYIAVDVDADAVGVETVGELEERDPAPTLEEGTLVVCKRTLRTSRLDQEGKSVRFSKEQQAGF